VEESKMKKSLILLKIPLLLVFSFVALAQQNGYDLFQKALTKERAEGNLEEAIQLYQQTVQEYADDRSLAAKALLHIGQCYEKLGKTEARKVYERLVRDYADQIDSAAEARKRLVTLAKPAVEEKTLATRQVWSGPQDLNEASPSPDGRYLSYVDWETGDLAVRDLQNNTNQRLTNKGSWDQSKEFALFSRWSPDGTQLAYDWCNGKGIKDVRIIGRQGGNQRNLVHFEDGEWLQTYDWSPDGKQILICLERTGGLCQIVSISVSDGAVKVIKTFETTERFPQVMRYSRDGKYIAYDQPQEKNDSAHDIFLISADGNEEPLLVKHPSDDRLLGWLPDGRGILFASDRTGSLEIWFLPVREGKPKSSPEIIPTAAKGIIPLGFTQNGSFYYARQPYSWDIYGFKMDKITADVITMPEKIIKFHEGHNTWAEYSPDGNHLAYISMQEIGAIPGGTALCVYSLETKKNREFPTEFRRLAGIRWSPDGHTIYTGAWDNEGMGLCRLNIQNGEISMILRAEPNIGFWGAHEITADGQSLIYQRLDQENDLCQIIQRDLATGVEHIIYNTNFSKRTTFSLSPDHKSLAAISTYEKQKILQLIPLSDGNLRVLLTFEEERSYYGALDWTADGRHIIFTNYRFTEEGNSPELWKINIEGGEPQKLNLELGKGSVNKLSIHPDGQQLLYSFWDHSQREASVWVIENMLTELSEKIGGQK
jgi:Tol biopolymer transport system component